MRHPLLKAASFLGGVARMEEDTEAQTAPQYGRLAVMQFASGGMPV